MMRCAVRVALLLGLAAVVQPQTSELSSSQLLACAGGGVDALQKWYNAETGLWDTTHWWNAANAVTVLVAYQRLRPSPEIQQAIANTFERNSDKKFLNKFYDDEGWWALAWIDAYRATNEARYLEMAEQIFADMSEGWDNTCNGGIWWNKDKRYKNAIANELFFAAAARLAAAGPKTKRAFYLDWANREWQWFDGSGMINSTGLINDGLTTSCKNNGRTTWTYNQGVILRGLSELSSLTGDEALRTRAQSIALAAIAHLTDADGILHDSCEPNCGADGVQFKGIFARNVGALDAVAPLPEFAKFLRTNAARVCANQSKEHRFGVSWSQASDVADAATQVSALDVILAAASLPDGR